MFSQAAWPRLEERAQKYQLAAAASSARPRPPHLRASGSTLDLAARAWLTAYLSPAGELEILAARDAERPVPMASITKLMTARLARQSLDLASTTAVMPSDLPPEKFDPSLIKPGESFAVRDLLASMLVESSNHSAGVLARLGGADFVPRMNQAAAALGMGETEYLNPSGLDEPDGHTNLSSASDLALLLEDIIEHEPELLAVSQQIAVPIRRADGSFHHVATNTNELLPLNRWPAAIVGGKTGQTDLARKNLVLVLRDSASGGYLINIVLGSENHFSDMTRLTDWVFQSYDFS